MLFNELAEIPLPNAVYLILLVGVIAGLGFRRPGTRLARARWLLLGLLAWCCIASTPGVGNWLIRELEERYPAAEAGADPRALVVVLSSGSILRRGDGWTVGMDLAAWERTMAGVRLWRTTGGELLFSGEPTPDGRWSAADAMAEVAASAGVPRASIRVERRSGTTYQNLLFSRELIAERDGHVWLVTSAMHMPRAMAVAGKLGLRVHAAPCDRRAVELRHWYAWLPNFGGPAMLADVLHERIGLALYRLRGLAA